MPELRRCIAPKFNQPTLECGKVFETRSMNQRYCDETCRNRAQKHAKLRRKRGFGYGLGAQAARIANPPTFYDPTKVQAAQDNTTAEVERALILAKLTEVDSEAELASLGYSPYKKAARWADDRAAEPKLSTSDTSDSGESPPDKGIPLTRGTPISDELNPPQFLNEEYNPDPLDPYGDLQPDKDTL